MSFSRKSLPAKCRLIVMRAAIITGIECAIVLQVIMSARLPLNSMDVVDFKQNCLYFLLVHLVIDLAILFCCVCFFELCV